MSASTSATNTTWPARAQESLLFSTGRKIGPPGVEVWCNNWTTHLTQCWFSSHWLLAVQSIFVFVCVPPSFQYALSVFISVDDKILSFVCAAWRLGCMRDTWRYMITEGLFISQFGDILCWNRMFWSPALIWQLAINFQNALIFIWDICEQYLTATICAWIQLEQLSLS